MKQNTRKLLHGQKRNARSALIRTRQNFRRSDEAEREADWEFVVKMMCIIKDLMNGNKNLPEGCEEETVGHNAHRSRFPGTETVDRLLSEL